VVGVNEFGEKTVLVPAYGDPGGTTNPGEGAARTPGDVSGAYGPSLFKMSSDAMQKLWNSGQLGKPGQQ